MRRDSLSHFEPQGEVLDVMLMAPFADRVDRIAAWPPSDWHWEAGLVPTSLFGFVAEYRRTATWDGPSCLVESFGLCISERTPLAGRCLSAFDPNPQRIPCETCCLLLGVSIFTVTFHRPLASGV